MANLGRLHLRHLFLDIRVLAHRVARHISGHRARYGRDTEEWEGLDIATVLEEVGLQPMQVYITRRQSHIAQYVATRPLIEEAIGAVRRSGSSYKRKFWWERILEVYNS